MSLRAEQVSKFTAKEVVTILSSVPGGAIVSMGFNGKWWMEAKWSATLPEQPMKVLFPGKGEND